MSKKPTLLSIRTSSLCGLVQTLSVLCHPQGKNETALSERDERLENVLFLYGCFSDIKTSLHNHWQERRGPIPPDSALGKISYLSLLARFTALRPSG